MLPRIEHLLPSPHATPERGQVVRQSSQAFVDLLAGEAAEAHQAESARAPVAASRPAPVGVSSRQNPVIPLPSSQVFDAAGTAKPNTALSVFAPKSGSGGSTAQTEAPAATTAPAFVPEFQQNLEVVSALGGSSPLNPIYFATQQTAQWIADKYGTGQVVARPYNATGGPYTANGTEYYIQLKDGRMVNAGLLADYYQRMSPAEADAEIRQGLQEV